jgi:prephenate dehydratase
MNEHLFVNTQFMFIIPSLVLASKSETVMGDYDVIINHAATNDLLKEIRNTTWREHKNVNSNTQACIEASESDLTSCVITNSACAEKYGLHINKVLRAGINMPFVMFSKKECA